MARGKKKVLSVKSMPEEQNKSEAERETKENKHENKKVQGRSPHRSAPLFPIIQKQNCSAEPEQLGPVKLVVEFHSSKEDNKGTTTVYPAPSLTHQNSSASTAALNKPKPCSHTKDKVSKSTQKKEEKKQSQNNRKVTDYFPIRRSSRKTQTKLKVEEQREIGELMKSGVEEGLQVKLIEGKGRGVFAVRKFQKGQFVVEYHGDLLQMAEAKAREARYAQEPETGCYMYYFQHLTNTYCVDATVESSRLGRLLNHSKSGNCVTRVFELDGVPHLVLLAARDITAGEELLYDYGDRSRDALAAHPWLKH